MKQPFSRVACWSLGVEFSAKKGQWLLTFFCAEFLALTSLRHGLVPLGWSWLIRPKGSWGFGLPFKSIWVNGPAPCTGQDWHRPTAVGTFAI